MAPRPQAQRGSHPSLPAPLAHRSDDRDGDAAHAPSPSSGQGASLSIEDGVQLAKNLRDLPGPGQAFAAFDRARRPRVQHIIKQAARVSNSKAATVVSRVFRDAMLPHILKLIANSKHSRQLYGYHIDWETR